MVATFDNSADEETPAAVVQGRLKAMATDDPAYSSLLNANLPRVETASRELAETIQPPGAKSAQASATLGRAIEVSGQPVDPEAVDESSSDAASISVHSLHAKQSAPDRTASAKTTQSQTGSPSLTDAASALASQTIEPVLPAIVVKTPVGSASQLPTLYPSDANAGAHPAIAPANPGSRGSVPNAVAPAPKAEPPAPNAVDRPLEAPASAAGETSASHPVIAENVPGTTADPTAVTTAGAGSNQPAESPKTVSGGVPAEPSTPSAVDNGVVSSLSSASDANAARPETAAARVTTGAQSIRVNHGGDSQLNPAVQGIHGQLNGATGGSAEIRDTATVLPSIPGAGPAPETFSDASPAATFSALDGANSSMHFTWTHAAPHEAEAGFEDPSLGWISVRAGLNAGSISAVVVPGSADATQALGAHMAGLHDYLADRHSPVESLTLATAQNSGADAGLSQGMQHQGQQQSAEDSPANAQTLNSLTAGSAAVQSSQEIHSSSDESQSILQPPGGRYISVMA
jgi:hypothetical protein